MITLTKVVKVTNNRYTFREMTVNPESVDYVEPDSFMMQELNEGKFPSDLSERTEFSRINISGNVFTVVGDVYEISRKLSSKRTLLKG